MVDATLGCAVAVVTVHVSTWLLGLASLSPVPATRSERKEGEKEGRNGTVPVMPDPTFSEH